MVAQSKGSKINVNGAEIALLSKTQNEYISITDIARYKDSKNPTQVISLWMRTYNTIAFIGLWEQLNNPSFKPHIYEGFKTESAKPTFWISPKKWIESTNAIGIISKSGRYGGTYADSEIAFEFASWISPEFKLYLVTEFKRLKNEEQERLSLDWNLQRTISKINYRIHTDAIKEHILPPVVTRAQTSHIYASEADLLNIALFGKTASQWRKENPEAEGNIRDEASLEQLVVLSNMESINALLIKQGFPQSERLIHLNQTAISQLTSLLDNVHLKKLSE